MALKGDWCPKLAKVRALVADPLLPPLADIVLEYGEPPSLEVVGYVTPEGQTVADVFKAARAHAHSVCPLIVSQDNEDARVQAQREYLGPYRFTTRLVACPYCPGQLHVAGRTISVRALRKHGEHARGLFFGIPDLWFWSIDRRPDPVDPVPGFLQALGLHAGPKGKLRFLRREKKSLPSQ